MKTIAYFGFAANPPHLGHLKAIEWLSSQVDFVLVAPSASHAFGKNMKDYALRLYWTDLLLKTSKLNLTNVAISTLENDLYHSLTRRPIYSYDVLCALRQHDEYDDYHIKLAVGPDNAEVATWSKFYRYQDIDLEFGKIIIPEVSDVVRSTDIRNALLNGVATTEYLAKYMGDLLAPELIKLNGDSKW